jgi:hypothetical protein
MIQQRTHRFRAMQSLGCAAIVIWGLIPAIASAAASDSTSFARADLTGLEATTAPPWNPPTPVERRRAWEQAMLLPGRIVSLPISALGLVTERGLRYGEEKGWIAISQNSVNPAGNARIQPQLHRLGGRAGIGAGLQLRQPVMSGQMKTVLSARYAATFRNYNGTLLAVTGRPLALQYGFDWRPEEHFYGIGNEAERGALSNYARQSEFLRLNVFDPWRTGDPKLRGTRGGLWIETRNQVMRTGRESGVPSFEEPFPGLGDVMLDRRVEHLIYGGTLSIDHRAGVSHWGHGGRLLLSAERHDAPIEALALRVSSPEGAQFNRYRIEGETGFTFMHTRSLRVLARVVDQQVNSHRERFLTSDLSMLGGRQGLLGFDQDRFQDLDLAYLRTSYVFPIARRLELDLHSEWGGVYSDVWKDPTLNSVQSSFGIAMRGVYVLGPVAAIGLDFSREGMRFNYTVGGIE